MCIHPRHTLNFTKAEVAKDGSHNWGGFAHIKRKAIHHKGMFYEHAHRTPPLE